MSDSNDYYDFEDRGPVIREQKREAFWRGLSLGLVIAAAVSVILTVLNVRTSLQARRIRDLYAGQVLDREEDQVQSVLPSGEESARDEKIRLLEQYIDAYYYRSEDVDEGERAEGIYRGLLEALEDP